jgi:hypothetical protein
MGVLIGKVSSDVHFCIHHVEIILVSDHKVNMLSWDQRDILNKVIITHYCIFIVTVNDNLALSFPEHEVDSTFVVHDHWHSNHFLTATSF